MLNACCAHVRLKSHIPPPLPSLPSPSPPPTCSQSLLERDETATVTSPPSPRSADGDSGGASGARVKPARKQLQVGAAPPLVKHVCSHAMRVLGSAVEAVGC